MATQEDKTNTGVVGTIVVVGAFSMIAVSSMLAAMVREERSELDATRPEHADLETVSRLDKEQKAKLIEPARWKDRGAGTITMPIERAQQLVLASYKADPAAASPPPPPGLVMDPQGAATPGVVVNPGVGPGATPGMEVTGDAAPGASAVGAGGEDKGSEPQAGSTAPASAEPGKKAAPAEQDEPGAAASEGGEEHK